METRDTGFGIHFLRGAATELFPCVETMVEIQKKQFVTNGAIPLQVNRISRELTSWAELGSSVCCRKMDSLIFLAPAAAESWTNHRLRSGSTNVTCWASWWRWWRQWYVCRVLHKNDVTHLDRISLSLERFRLTPYNFTPNHLTFTVSAISEDVAVKTHSRVKASTSPTSGRPEWQPSTWFWHPTVSES